MLLHSRRSRKHLRQGDQEESRSHLTDLRPSIPPVGEETAKAKSTVRVSSRCCNRSPQTRCLQTAHIIILELRSPKTKMGGQGCDPSRGSREESMALAFLRAAPRPWLVAHASLISASLLTSPSQTVPLLRALVTTLSPLGSSGTITDLEVLNLIPSTKCLLPQKATQPAGSEHWDVNTLRGP